MGKTTSPENFTSLLDDVKARLFDVLPDDTWFYPDHGDDSTLGEQKPHIDEWRACCPRPARPKSCHTTSRTVSTGLSFLVGRSRVYIIGQWPRATVDHPISAA